MKSNKQIKAYILKMGAKRTNVQMVETLKVPTMTFAGVLAGMKRKKEITNNFLKTDILKASKTTKVKATKKTTNKATKKVTFTVAKSVRIKASDLNPELAKRLGASLKNSNSIELVLKTA